MLPANTFADVAIVDLDLENITVPMLLLQGRADTDVLPQHSELAAERIPGALLQWVARGGHLAGFTDHGSAAIKARIVEFLQSS